MVKLALALEHPGDAVSAAELAGVSLEDLPELGGRAVAVFGHDLAEDGRAAGAIAFVEHFLHIAALDLARAALDGSLDVVLGHADGFGVVDRKAEANVGVWIAAAHLGRDDDRLRQLRPKLAALGIDGRFAVLDVRPRRMASHKGRRQGTGIRRQREDQRGFFLARPLAVERRMSSSCRFLGGGEGLTGGVSFSLGRSLLASGPTAFLSGGPLRASLEEPLAGVFGFVSKAAAAARASTRALWRASFAAAASATAWASRAALTAATRSVIG